MQLAMRAVRIAVWIKIAGAATQPIAACAARYRVPGVTQIHCRSQRVAGDAGRQDRHSDQNRRGRYAAHRRLHAGSLQGPWRYADPL